MLFCCIKHLQVLVRLLSRSDSFDLRQPLLASLAFLVPLLACETWFAAIMLLLFHYLLSAAPASASLHVYIYSSRILNKFSLGQVCLAWFLVHSSHGRVRHPFLVLHADVDGDIGKQLHTLAHSDCVSLYIINQPSLLKIILGCFFLFHYKVGVLTAHYYSKVIRDWLLWV